MRKLLFILGFVLFAIPAKANDFYVSQNGGGSGTSCSSTFNVAWFNTAGSWGTAANQIGPGSTVHLCGTFTGTPGQQLLIASGSGTSGSPIRILFENGAKLSSPYWPGNGAIDLNGQSFMVIDGGTNGIIENTANGSNLPNQQHSLGINASTGSHVEIQNVTFSDIYVRTPDVAITNITGNGTTATVTCATPCNFAVGLPISIGGNSNSGFNVSDAPINSTPTSLTLTIASSTSGSGTAGQAEDGYGPPAWERCVNWTGDYFSFHDNVAHDVGWCLNGSSNHVSIFNNDLSSMDHGLLMGAAGTNSVFTDVQFYGNHLHDFALWDSPVTQHNHHDGIHLFASCAGAYCTSNVITGFQIYNNLFDGDWGTTTTAHIFLQKNIQNGSVYNNVSNDSCCGRNLTNGAMVISLVNVKAYNNTVIGSGSTSQKASCVQLNGNGILLENNVIANCGELVGTSNGGIAGGYSVDHNIYANGGNNAFVWCPPDGSKCTFTSLFATWTALSGDQGSRNVATAGLDSSGSLQTNSPARSAGVDESSLCSVIGSALCSDTSAGNTRKPVARPAGSAWDVGAFAFGLDANQPAAPSGLKATVQ